ncbi:IclR family transcriptional regulator [Micromonospora inositola]|uniref:IclR family transcriptional regulator n=1 Tax=Micromonospora inositola TaxID=47865 RepID=UPI00155FB029|nr:IclR family transcriptional regulator [Micromonospora inositola]
MRAAQLLSSFGSDRPVMTLAELVSESAMPKSTVHRLAEQLVLLGWLERDPNGYRIGIRLFEIGGLADRYKILRDCAMPHLHALSARTGLAVQLGVLHETNVVYLERILVRGFQLPTRQGGRMPAYCTALGKALLAFGSAADVERLMSVTLTAFTRNTMASPNALLRELAQARQAGYAQDREEAYAGVSCISVPLRGSGRAVAAFSLCGRPSQVSVSEHLPQMERVAAAVWADVIGHGSQPGSFS